MKKLFCILIFVLFHFICLSQNDFGGRDFFGREGGNFPQENEQDSVPEQTVPHFRHTWKWMRQGVYAMQIPLDTLMDGIHNYNYIFKKSISNTYLGNFPSPYVSNIFMERDRTEDFYFQTYIRSFLFKPEDALNFNTTTPFTRLKYFTGGGKGKAENLLDVWHVQNIRPWWSAGIRYNLISSDGRYANQKSKAYNFSLFSTYEKGRVALSLFLNQNNGHIQENGGIKDKTYVTDSTGQKAENMPVWLTGNEAQNDYRNLNFNFQAQYNIGKAKKQIQGSDTLDRFPAKAVFNFRAEGNEHKYSESNINFDFFPATYLDSTSTSNHERNRIFEATAKFVLNEHPRLKYLPGLYAGAKYLREEYRHLNSFDTLTLKADTGKNCYNSTFIQGGIFNTDSTASLHYDVAAEICLAGEKAGNMKLDGWVCQFLNASRNSQVKANARFELKNANPFLQQYIGNHDIWKNDFKEIKSLHVDGRYTNTRLRTEIGIGIDNIYSHIYFDTLARPVQTDKTLMVLTAWVEETFRLGKFYFNQHVYFQKSNEEDILSLPDISLYSHNYYQNHLFKNALELQFGFDLFYHTGFYSDNYMPSTMQFFMQRKEKTGNYPKIDIFLNLHIKRAHLFAKYEHLNHVFKSNGNYFSASDYPINPSMFKFGIKWDFFD